MRVPHPSDLLFMFDKRLYQRIPKKGVMPDSKEHEKRLDGLSTAMMRLLAALGFLLFIPGVLTICFSFNPPLWLSLCFTGLVIYQFYLMFRSFRLTNYLQRIAFIQLMDKLNETHEEALKLMFSQAKLKEVLNREADSQESQDHKKGP